ncbi:MAG: hypothetical protein LLF92_05310 [Planctomycetaceae bacterium]|nr:hypothetical protein [Planctomycetaceae bacterium]
MSQNDTEIQGSDEQEQRGEKLVDVSEAIRYRKRAQMAEQKKTLLEQALIEHKSEIEKLNRNISQMSIERQLIDKFVSAGVKDLEAAVIIGRSRLEKDSQVSADDVVEQMRKEKSYLFSESPAPTVIAKTSGVKNKLSQTTGVLERAAKKASQTSSRADLQEYLRTRRNLL